MFNLETSSGRYHNAQIPLASFAKKGFNMNDFNELIERLWNEEVNQKFVYRGMDENDLNFPLNPNNDPYSEYKELIINFLDLLDKLLNEGLQFIVIENHFGKKYTHDPKNLSSWSRRDINRKEIDFTSHYQSAKEYSDCWQGSQLKQNLKSIANHFLSNFKSISTAYNIKNYEWEFVKEINAWLNVQRKPKPIIIHLKRNCDLFKRSSRLLPLGSRISFEKVIYDKYSKVNEFSYEFLYSMLPNADKEFYCSVDKPLLEKDIYKIEKL